MYDAEFYSKIKISIGGASALLAASVFHFAEFSIKEVKTFLNNNNIPVRI